MRKQIFRLDGRAVTLSTEDTPQVLFIQPVDEHDTALLDAEIEAMRDCALPFALATFEVRDWNRELSPWEAPPVFGKIPFGGMAEETFSFVLDRLLPELRRRFGADIKFCIGGYSLAGLFALWAAARTDAFSGVAAASPSVWFPDWMEYVKKNPIQAKTVYLSLGDREERAKNPLMATVGDCIREQYALLQADHIVTLEWNPGNHFQDSEKRTARAFCWIAEQEKQGQVERKDQRRNHCTWTESSPTPSPRKS